MNWASENELLLNAGQIMAAGIMEERNQSWPQRLARGYRRYLDAAPLPAVNPEKYFFPTEKEHIWYRFPNQAVEYTFSYTTWVNFDRLEELRRESPPETAPVWNQIFGDLHDIQDMEIPPRFCIGGGAYTHSILDYGTLVDAGLAGTRARLEKGRAAAANDADKLEWYAACEEMLAALERYVLRVAEHLRRHKAPERLCKVFEKEIWHGAGDFYSALAIFNFFWYLDGCDSVGRFDAYMDKPFRMRPVEPEEAKKWLRELWYNFDCCEGWHLVVGGHSAPGVPSYTELTELVVGTYGDYRRPNAGLLVSEDMPEHYWDLVFDNFVAGGVNPALYNEAGYLKRMAELTGMSPDNPDMYKMAYGGCTEMMFSGCSNVGSIDAGLNVLEIFANTVKEYLTAAAGFEDFLARFKRDLTRQMKLMLASLDQSQRNMALYWSQPVRNLFIGDCLERGLDYNAGGARYNGSVINLGGMSNVYNSLWAVRECFEGKLPFGPARLAEMLKADFEGFGNELRLLAGLPKFGNGHAALDAMAGELMGMLFAMINGHKTVRGVDGGYAIPGVIMFVTYEMFGSYVPATPDGRRAGAPLGDSVGPVQGTDLEGPTALLQSCAALPQEFGLGTLILNLRLDAELLKSREGREKLKALLKTYFAAGGLQVQMSMADTAVLEAALAEPEKYPQLMVRIGGYSEYFNRLSDGLKREVIKRTIVK